MSMELFRFLIFLCYVGLFFLMRHLYILDVRCEFIDDKELYPKKYRTLPTFNTMVFHPCHFFRFTKKQWVKWVNRKLGQS